MSAKTMRSKAKRSKAESVKPEPRTVEIPHRSYQPSVTELREDMRMDSSFEEVVSVVLRPAKIRYVMHEKGKR